MPQLTAAIVVVILVNAVFSHFQEHRAEQAVAALRKMLPLRVRVRRDGQPAEVASEEVVPGDVLLLAPGVAADLLAASELRVNQWTLTGESAPVAPDVQVSTRSSHTSALGPWHWLVLLVWPPVVLGAEEERKAVVRRRSAPDDDGSAAAALDRRVARR